MRINAFLEEESLNEVGGSETKIEAKTFLMENPRQSVALAVSSKAVGSGYPDYTGLGPLAKMYVCQVQSQGFLEVHGTALKDGRGKMRVPTAPRACPDYSRLPTPRMVTPWSRRIGSGAGHQPHTFLEKFPRGFGFAALYTTSPPCC